MKIYIGRIPEIVEENLLTDAWLYDMLKKYGHKDIGAMIVWFFILLIWYYLII